MRVSYRYQPIRRPASYHIRYHPRIPDNSKRKAVKIGVTTAEDDPHASELANLVKFG